MLREIVMDSFGAIADTLRECKNLGLCHDWKRCTSVTYRIWLYCAVLYIFEEGRI